MNQAFKYTTVFAVAFSCLLANTINKEEQHEENKIHKPFPSLDIHGSFGLGYYYSENKLSPLDDFDLTYNTSNYQGIGLGYMFRPSIFAVSTIELENTKIETTLGLTARPTSSYLSLYNSFPLAQYFNNSDEQFSSAKFSTWVMSADNYKYGRFELGKSLTNSAKSTSASFSPFHRLRGGYEDFLAVNGQDFITENNFSKSFIIDYFGATVMLQDAPHISYTSPEIYGTKAYFELSPNIYTSDIGSLKSGAYAVGFEHKGNSENLQYEVRASFADGIGNGVLHRNFIYFYDNINIGNVFGQQINASAAIAHYTGFNASISAGFENNSKIITGDFFLPINLTKTYKDIKPSIVEVISGYTFHNKYLGGKSSFQLSYASAKDYARYADPDITSSKATMRGLALGHFIGNMAVEFKVQYYTTSNTTNPIVHDYSIYTPSGRTTIKNLESQNKPCSGTLLSLNTLYYF